MPDERWPVLRLASNSGFQDQSGLANYSQWMPVRRPTAWFGGRTTRRPCACPLVTPRRLLQCLSVRLSTPSIPRRHFRADTCLSSPDTVRRPVAWQPAFGQQRAAGRLSRLQRLFCNSLYLWQKRAHAIRRRQRARTKPGRNGDANGLAWRERRLLGVC